MLPAYFLLPFLLSCGPEDCDDLTFAVDTDLDDEQDLWDETMEVYEKCEGVCANDQAACEDSANGVTPADPTDTGALPTLADCEEDYGACEEVCIHPSELDYPYTKNEHSPLIAWNGGAILGVTVSIASGSKKDDVIWSIKCSDEDENCLQTPVAYGSVPDGAELNLKGCKNKKCDGEERKFLVDGGSYKIGGGRVIPGKKYPCAAAEDGGEFEFEYPNRTPYSYD